MSLKQSIRVERVGYYVAVDFPGDEHNPGTYRAQAGRLILATGLDRDEAERIVIACWESERATVERRAVLALEATSSVAAHDRLHADLVAAVNRLAVRFTDVEIDVHDRSPWLIGRRMTFDAIEAELFVRERADDLAEHARRSAEDAREGASA